jgi:hypothetical protein
MIRYDDTTWISAINASGKSLCARVVLRTSGTAKILRESAAAGLLRFRRHMRIGWMRWIVTTNTIALSDFEHLHGYQLVFAGQKMKRPKLGLLGQWCEKSCRGRFRQIRSGQWSFSDKRDARQFDLIWGSGRIDPETPWLNREDRYSAT